MKKNISFEKKITFPTMIGEISAIDLEHNLKFVDLSNIEGEFIVKGKYKLTEASRLEEDFSYNIPVEIALAERLDLNTTNIEIVDFYYEIENDDVMICYIEIKIEGLEVIEIDEKDEDDNLERIGDDRECDGEIKKEEEKEIPHKNKEEEIKKEELEKRNEYENQKVENKENEGDLDMNKNEVVVENEEENEEVESISTIFSSLSEKEETFSTYAVYILREEDSINTIIDKYKTTKEELEKYNDLNNLTKGSKIIIPMLNND